MLKGRINLTDRRVVMPVIVLLAGIIVLNWRVFQPLRAKRAIQAVSSEDVVRIPADLNEMFAFASMQLAREQERDSMPTEDARVLAGSSLRDPFTGATGVHKSASGGSEGRFKGMSCSAVALGEGDPVALINGRTYRIGDMVRGYMLEGIDYGGVRLSKGKRSFLLPVVPRGKRSGYYPVVGDRSGKKP